MKLIQRNIQKLIKAIAAETGFPIAVVTDIVSSEFEFVRTEMAKGDLADVTSFKSILLKYLGTFQFAVSKRNAIVKSKEANKIKEDAEHC